MTGPAEQHGAPTAMATHPSQPAPRVDAVLIGRNEGARLLASIASVRPLVRQLVYVDSGSADGSVAAAGAAGATVTTLDPGRPFTAARARNAGFAALAQPRLVLFVDGDCRLDPGFLPAAVARLEADPGLAVVTGWRREVAPRASVYNALCDWEWHQPAGPIRVCGGDMLVRADAWRAVGGMRDTVIAAEDDEFCLRLGQAGWRLERLPLTLTHHDAAMVRFGQWWARAERAGHGFAQVGALHPGHFAAERRRAWLYGAVLPLATLGALALWPPLAPVPLAAYPVSHMRAARRFRAARRAPAHGLAALLTLSKVPNLVGMLRYHLRRRRGAAFQIIEYK